MSSSSIARSAAALAFSAMLAGAWGAAYAGAGHSSDDDGHDKPSTMPSNMVDSMRETHRSHVLVWLEWGSAVREDVWPAYRAFTEQAVAITRRTFERGQREGSVAADADCESLARLFASTSQSIARLQLGDVDPDTIRRFQETLLRAVLLPNALESASSPTPR